MFKFKNFISACVAVCMMCQVGVIAFAEDSSDQAEVNVLQEGEVDTIINSLDKDWYGGVYYVDDTVHIIATQNNAEALQSKLMVRRKLSDGITIVVDNPDMARNQSEIYSMNELEAAKEDLLNQQDELGIVGIGFNGQENALAVYLDYYDDVTEEEKENIIQISPIKNILFRDAAVLGLDSVDTNNTNTEENMVTEDELKSARLTVYGGNKVSGNGHVSTLTTSAVYDWQGPDQAFGFMTCGHDYSVGESVYYSGVYLGEVTHVFEGGTVDFSFIESSYNSNGEMKDGAVLTHRTAPTTGMRVKSYGCVSGIKTGYVDDTNISGEWADIYFSDLFSTDISTKKGDSGAAFTYNNSYLVGLMKGGLGGYDESVGVNITNIMDYNVQPSC